MAIYNLIETVGMMILYYSFLFIVYKILVWEKVRRDIEEEIPVAREASSQEEDSDKEDEDSDEEDEDSDEEDEDSDDEDEEDEDGDDETSLPEEQSTKEE
jgi:flagellar biosynthesis/type III secretory pathway M-ring protein FliF/YscJ